MDKNLLNTFKLCDYVTTTYGCKKCRLNFQTFQQLQDHCNIEHKNHDISLFFMLCDTLPEGLGNDHKSPQTCKRCKAQCLSLNKLKFHYLDVHQTKIYHCILCDGYYEKPSTFRSHNLKHHNREVFIEGTTCIGYTRLTPLNTKVRAQQQTMACSTFSATNQESIPPERFVNPTVVEVWKRPPPVDSIFSKKLSSKDELLKIVESEDEYCLDAELNSNVSPTNQNTSDIFDRVENVYSKDEVKKIAPYQHQSDWKLVSKQYRSSKDISKTNILFREKKQKDQSTMDVVIDIDELKSIEKAANSPIKKKDLEECANIPSFNMEKRKIRPNPKIENVKIIANEKVDLPQSKGLAKFDNIRCNKVTIKRAKNAIECRNDKLTVKRPKPTNVLLIEKENSNLPIETVTNSEMQGQSQPLGKLRLRKEYNNQMVIATPPICTPNSEISELKTNLLTESNEKKILTNTKTALSIAKPGFYKILSLETDKVSFNPKTNKANILRNRRLANSRNGQEKTVLTNTACKNLKLTSKI